jgi:hypothetical protein
MLRVLALVVTIAVAASAQNVGLEDASSRACSNCVAADSASTTGSVTNPPDGFSSSLQISHAAADPALLPTANLSSLAQPIMAVATPRLPEKPQPTVKQRRTWWALTIAQHGAATFDAWSTRKALSSGNGYERNPLMRPFAGSAAIYPVIQVLPVGLDYASQKMMRSRHGFLRKTWWVPQMVATAGFIWAGARNLNVANRR